MYRDKDQVNYVMMQPRQARNRFRPFLAPGDPLGVGDSVMAHPDRAQALIEFRKIPMRTTPGSICSRGRLMGSRGEVRIPVAR